MPAVNISPSHNATLYTGTTLTLTCTATLYFNMSTDEVVAVTLIGSNKVLESDTQPPN